MPNRSTARTGQARGPSGTVHSPDREHWIAEAAYFLSERRDFAPGYELHDWLEAERAFNAHLAKSTRKRPPHRQPPADPVRQRVRTMRT
ncbi:MAG: DUF2934 domain-containing protein [Gammaproteobacteria bacterium]